MSAKLTVILFILICFEIGVLLIILPWIPSPTWNWNENYLLVLASDHLHWPWLSATIKSGFVRGAVSGLGVLNIILGIREVVNFKKTTRVLHKEWKGEQVPPSTDASSGLRDHRQEPAPDGKPDRDAATN
jgi:hypothetical protein